jgi:hypothetical protein
LPHREEPPTKKSRTASESRGKSLRGKSLDAEFTETVTRWCCRPIAPQSPPRPSPFAPSRLGYKFAGAGWRRTRTGSRLKRRWPTGQKSSRRWSSRRSRCGRP